MMASSCSGYSCEAPTDFQLPSSLENSSSRFSTALLKCPLCNNSRKTFYCIQCIQNGDFFHSNHHYPERFAEKQLQMLRLKNEVNQVEECCKNLLERRLQEKRKCTDVQVFRERVHLLEILISQTKENIKRGEEEIVSLRKANSESRARLPRYEERVNKMSDFADQMVGKTEHQKKKLARIHEQLKQTIRTGVQQLIRYIFPISNISQEIISQSESSELLEGSEEISHRIVAPSLPSCGDYSAFGSWLASGGDGVPGESVERNQAHNITAALTYTAQLVDILAYYSDTRLPHKLSYGDFCSNELKNDRFTRLVARLNANILHLCFSQNVSPEFLHPNRTLGNVLCLLDQGISDLGRQGPLEVSPSLARCLEEQLTKDLEPGDHSDSEEESDSLQWDWEAVPSTAVAEGSTMQLNPQQTTSMASGLVISAAASIASIWRGWTGNK